MAQRSNSGGLGGALGLALALLLQASGVVAQTPPRKDISELTAAELASLRRGVAQMKTWNTATAGSADYRRSWIYWSNMHYHFGDDCGGPVPRAPGMTSVRPAHATNEDTDTWCKCEHGTGAFLTWHRMYLYYFEKVLQAAAGDQTLRLPYWDYNRSASLPPAFLPPTYLDSGLSHANPLYAADRRLALSRGRAMAAETVEIEAPFQAKDYNAFNGLIEGTPHGAVHCAIGSQGCGTGLMGHPASAALDPIFYLHHANIDRLYECWMSPDPTRREPGAETIQDQAYSFPDGTGVIRKRAVADMVRVSQLDYGYSRMDACPVAPMPGGASMLSLDEPQSYPIGGPARIGQGTTVIALQPTAPALEAIQISPMLSSQTPETTIVFSGLTYDSRPGSLYAVYVATLDKTAFVGLLDFFARGGGQGAHHHDTREVRLPATAAFSQLALTAEDAGRLRFEIVPITGVEGDSEADAITLNEPTNNLRYDSVHLVVERE